MAQNGLGTRCASAMAAVLLLSGAAMAAGAEGAVHGSGTAKASSAVTSVAFSPDGTKVLIGSADFTASLWDATTSALVGIFTGHTGQVNSVAFSPDGTKVLTAAIGYEFSLNFYYTEIKLWNAATGELIRDFTMYTDHVVYSVAFSPDGTKALSGEGYYNSFLGTSQGNARLWDVATGTEIRSFTGHTGEVFSAAFSPDGTKVLTGSADNTARLWDTDSGTEIRSFAGHWSQVRSVAFSPDGSMALTGSADVTAKLWKTGTGEEIRTFTGHMDEIRSVAFSPDGTTVLTGSRDNTARLWNAASGAKVYTFTGHTDWVNSVAFSPDGTRAVTGSSDGTAKWWAAGGPVPDLRGLTEAEAGAALIAASLTSGEVTQECSNDVAAGQVISQSPAADSLASYGSAVALRVSTGPCNAPVYSAVFSPDGTTVLAGKQDGTAVLLDTATGATLNTLTGHTWQVNSVAFSPDGTQALTGGNGYDFQLSLPLGEIKLWNAATGKLIRDFTTHTDARVNSVAFSPDGTKVLTGEGVHNSETDTWSGATWLWNAATGREIHSFTGHTGEVYSAAFSPDGTKVLTGSADNTAKLWYTDSGTEIRTFSGHADQVRSVAFSPDGTTVLTGSWDYTARLWNAGTGNRIRSFSGHTNAVNSVAFSPDGIAVLTGSWDYTAKLWFAATGAEFYTFTGHADQVRSVAFSPDGTKALTGSDDGKALWWATGPVVPDVTGLTQSEADAAFASVQLGAGTVTQGCSDTVSAGKVISQIPAAGISAYYDSTVALVISTGNCDVTVPNVTGMTRSNAEYTLTEAHLTTGTVAEECSNTVTVGLVIRQTPAADNSAPYGSAVDLVVSSGPCDVIVPDITGLTQESANSALSGSGLVMGTVTQQCSGTVAAGLVISQNPEADSYAPYGSAVSLVVSAGSSCDTTVPDVVGQTQDAAGTAFTNAGLSLGAVTQECSDTVTTGLVISQNPAAGTQEVIGGTVALVVSAGPCDTTVPNVTGQTQTEAATTLSTANLITGTVTQECSNTVAMGLVISQNPAANTTIPSGSAVALVLSSGPCPLAAPVAAAATNVASTGFTAHWSAVTGAAGYRLDVSTTALFSSFVSGYNGLDVAAATSLAVSGLGSDTRYFYRVRAYNGDGPSDNSNTIMVYTTLPGYTFTSVIVGGGSVTPASGTTHLPGTPLVVTANPALNWTFDHWEGDLAGNEENPAALNMTGNRSVTAVFRRSGPRTLQGTISNSITGNPVQGVYVEVSAVITERKAIAHATTDSDGRYSMEVPEDTGAITFNFTCPEYMPQTKNFTSPPLAAVDIVLVPVGVTTPKIPVVFSGPRSVFVEWDANPEYNLKGYYVHRVTTDAGGNPTGAPEKISALITDNEYSDTGTGPGTSYRYYVQALSGADRPSSLSSASKEVKAQFLTVFTPDVTVSDTLANLYLWDFTPENLLDSKWVRIPLSARSAYEVSAAGMQLVVELPTTLLDVTAGADIRVEPTGITSGMSVTHEVSTPGELSITASAPAAGRSLYGSGTLFDVYVQKKNTKACEPMTLVRDTVAAGAGRSGVVLYDDSSPRKSVPLLLENGTLCTMTSGDCLHGDVNGDKIIDVQDVVRIRELYVGRFAPTECSTFAGDLNLDGRVDSADAIQLQRWLAGQHINPPASGTKAAAEIPTFSAVNGKAVPRPEVWVGAASGAAGGSITVPVTIRNASALTGCTMTVNFLAGSQGLVFVSAAPGATLAGSHGISSMEKTHADYGSVVVALNGTEPLGTAAATQLVMLSFTVGSTVPVGTSLPLRLAAFEGNDCYGLTPRHDAPGQATIVKSPETVTVPDVKGQAQEAATARLTGEGLTVGAPTQQCSPTVPAGLVVSQTPAAGGTVASGSAVTLVVSTGPCSVTVPNVVGQTQAAATAAITGAGLTLGAVTEVYSATVASGSVVSQNPEAAASAALGTAVALAVSKGSETTAADLLAKLQSSFAAIDTDGNKKISYAEALAVLPGLTQAVFNAVDSAGDGQISYTEAGLKEPQCGCSGGKGSFTPDTVRELLSSLFLGGLSLTVLLVFGRRQP